MASITVVGAGLVGVATGKALLAKGHAVRFVDVKKETVDHLRELQFRAYMFDDLGLDWADADVSVICVNTPVGSDGRVILDNLRKAITTLASGLKDTNAFHVVVVRSTVPPTITEGTVRPLLEQLSGRAVGERGNLGLCVNPQFIRRITALEDSLRPWLTLVGLDANHERVKETMAALYEPFRAPVYWTDWTTAEVVKYVCSVFNATKISFFNEVHSICEALGVDSREVSRATVRLAEGIWNPGYGTRGGHPYGGASLPFDTVAFYRFARDLGVETPVLAGTIQTNQIALARRASAPTPSHIAAVVPPEQLAAEATEYGLVVEPTQEILQAERSHSVLAGGA
jgi:UDPglucose 6-dehydrogenase